MGAPRLSRLAFQCKSRSADGSKSHQWVKHVPVPHLGDPTRGSQILDNGIVLLKGGDCPRAGRSNYVRPR